MLQVTAGLVPSGPVSCAAPLLPALPAPSLLQPHCGAGGQEELACCAGEERVRTMLGTSDTI